jgi:hypothetical protein
MSEPFPNSLTSGVAETAAQPGAEGTSQTMILALPSLANVSVLVPSVAVLDTMWGLLHDWLGSKGPPCVLSGDVHCASAGTSGTLAGLAPCGEA